MARKKEYVVTGRELVDWGFQNGFEEYSVIADKLNNLFDSLYHLKSINVDYFEASEWEDRDKYIGWYLKEFMLSERVFEFRLIQE